MQSEQIKAQISQMALSEKLALVEDVWNEIATGHQEVPLPEWQQQELDKRYQAYQNDQLVLHDWEAVHQTLRSKSGSYCCACSIR